MSAFPQDQDQPEVTPSRRREQVVSCVPPPEAGAGTSPRGGGVLGLRSVSIFAVFSASQQLPSAP